MCHQGNSLSSVKTLNTHTHTQEKFTHSSDKKDNNQSGPEEDCDEEQQQQEGMLLAGVAVLLIERV